MNSKATVNQGGPIPLPRCISMPQIMIENADLNETNERWKRQIHIHSKQKIIKKYIYKYYVI